MNKCYELCLQLCQIHLIPSRSVPSKAQNYISQELQPSAIRAMHKSQKAVGQESKKFTDLSQCICLSHIGPPCASVVVVVVFFWPGSLTSVTSSW